MRGEASLQIDDLLGHVDRSQLPTLQSRRALTRRALQHAMARSEATVALSIDEPVLSVHRWPPRGDHGRWARRRLVRNHTHSPELYLIMVRMTEISALGAAGGDGLLRRLRLVLLTALFGLSACVSDALPRDDDDDDGAAPRRDASADARDGDAGDARRADASRTDAQDTTVTADSDSAADTADAGAERPVVDASADLSVSDVADAADGGGPDVTTDPGVTDAVPDQTTGDADAGADAEDATTTDVNDSGPSVDASDSGGSVDADDAGGANDASDASNGSDTNDAGTPLDAADARDGASDTADGGVVVLFQENFDSDIGVFTRDATVCGLAPPVWSNASGFAHASEPIGTGASRIISPTITVPTNVSNVRLRMSHRFNTELGYDAAQLFVSVNGLAVMHVTTFTTGGHVNGGITNPNSCTLGTTAGQFPGWSGNQPEFISEVNLAAAPFNVGADDTVSIVFRMTVDPLMSGAGWDINWVTLSGTSP